MLFSNVLVISSLLAGFAQAAPARGPQVSLSTLVGDIVCPRGTSLFHAQTDGLVPNTTPSKVWQHIGNFENADWRDLDLLSTTGLPNAGGSGRSYYMKGAVITEQLNINVGSASGATPYLPYFYQQYNIIGTSTLAGAKVSKVHNFLSVSKKSDGAYINWEVVGCADDTDNAEVLFEQVAQGGIKKTIAKFRG